MGKVSDYSEISLETLTQAAAATGAFKIALNGDDYKLTLQNLLMGLTGSIDPHHPMFAGGAKGDCLAVNNGSVSGGNQLTIPNHTPKTYYVGKSVFINGVERTVASINGGAYVLSSSVGNGTSLPILMGTDDTAAINAALAYAAAVRVPYGDGGGADAGVNVVAVGGLVQLRSASYLISNSQASYTGGKLSAIQVPRRVAFLGQGIHTTQLHFKPGSYGHIVAPKLIGSSAWIDLIEIGRFSVYGYRGWNPNGLNGLHLDVAFDGYSTVDPMNQIHDIRIQEAPQDAYYFGGRGEAVIQNVHAYFTQRYGLHLRAFNDSKIINCNFGGSNKTGIRIYASGACTLVGIKSFFSGAGGGAVAADCAGIHMDGDTLFSGNVNLTDVEVQESRGSSLVVQSGSNRFSNVRALDPGRSSIAGGTLPSVVAGWDLNGSFCRQNTFSDCTAGPSLGLFQADNWGNAGNSVNIDGSAEANRGNIWTFVPTTGPPSEPGTDYDGGFGAKGGAGISNGKNTLLKVDGVALT